MSTPSFKFPGGTPPLIQTSVGLHCALVNGVAIFRDGKYLEALPGQLLRSTEVIV